MDWSLSSVSESALQSLTASTNAECGMAWWLLTLVAKTWGLYTAPHTPADSLGLRRTQIPDSDSVTLGQISSFSPEGVRRSPQESARVPGVCQSPRSLPESQESARVPGVCQSPRSLPESQELSRPRHGHETRKGGKGETRTRTQAWDASRACQGTSSWVASIWT